MKKIFVVWGGDFYEAAENLRAFENEDDAKRFVTLLQEYQQERPRLDTSELGCEIGSKEFSREFDLWREKIADWEKRSPVFEGYRGADDFGVSQVDFYETSKLPTA